MDGMMNGNKKQGKKRLTLLCDVKDGEKYSELKARAMNRFEWRRC